MRGLAWLLLACLLVPLASAGSDEDPEITDPADDQELFSLVPISQQPPALTSVGLNSDILRAWVQDVGDDILFTIRLQGTGAPTTTSASVYEFHFETGGTAYVASAHVAPGGNVGNGAVTPGGVATAATSGASLVTLTVPKAAIGSPGPGAVLTGLFATAEGVLLDEVGDFTSDRAPDAGAGRDFVLPGPDVPPMVYIETALPVTNATTDATTAVVQYNWTGGAPLHLQAVVEAGDLSLNLSIQGETVLRWNGTSLDEILSARACLDAGVEPVDCTYALRVDMQDFVGSFSVQVVEEQDEEEPVAPEDPEQDAPEEDPQDNETVEDQPADKESPGLALPLAAVGLALAARRRR